jgi:hypothetical protein
LIADGPIDHAWEDDFSLALGYQRDTESCSNKSKHALLARRVTQEANATAHERGVEPAGRLARIPPLHEEGLAPQRTPIDGSVAREQMAAWQCCSQPLAVERRCYRVRPQRMPCEERDIDAPLAYRRLNLQLIHLEDRQRDVAVPLTPVREKTV